MQYLLLLGTRAEAWHRLSSTERAKEHRRIGAWFARLGSSGVEQERRKLHRARTALTVRARGGAPLVTAGPFSGNDEVIVAYVVLDVPDLDAAVEWAKSWPMPDATVEVRPLH